MNAQKVVPLGRARLTSKQQVALVELLETAWESYSRAELKMVVDRVACLLEYHGESMATVIGRLNPPLR